MSVYEIVTQQIVEALDRGVVAWHKPWRGDRNLVSKRDYRGSNVLLLGLAEHESPYWLTFRQAKQLGGSVKRGSRAQPVTFWKRLRVVDAGEEDAPDDEAGRTVPMLRYYRVFNLEQCEGIDAPAIEPNEHEPIEQAECIATAYINGPKVKSGSSALYDAESDIVRVPAIAAFESAETYYATLFHELAHSTGHKSRLNRKIENGYGTQDYSREELVAEIGAAFLCGKAQLKPDIEHHASYIDGWRRKLANEPKLIVQAASAAQKASDWILGERAGAGEGVLR